MKTKTTKKKRTPRSASFATIKRLFDDYAAQRFDYAPLLNRIVSFSEQMALALQEQREILKEIRLAQRKPPSILDRVLRRDRP